MLSKKDELTFEDFVNSTSQEKNSDGLFKSLVKAVSNHGFDRVIFSVSRDDELTLQQQIGVLHNYPEDWQKYYIEKQFEYIDPVLRYAAQKMGAFRWADIEDNVAITKKQKLCLRMGEEAGLHNGIGVPLRGNKSQLAGVALATSSKVDVCDTPLDLINAYCNQFYIAYKRLHQPAGKVEIAIELSKKELEILSWARAGKTDHEISIILNISTNTVNTHLRHIFEKLGVNNRITAVVKAINLGIIFS